MILQKLKTYDSTACTFGALPEEPGKAFILRVTLKKPVPDEATLLTWPGALTLVTRSVADETAGEGWGWNENYRSYLRDGKATLLELSIFLHSPYHPERVEMKLGVPLTLYDFTEAPLEILYDGTHLRMIFRGLVINENWPVGSLRFHTAPKVDAALCEASYSSDLPLLKTGETENRVDATAAYYTPYGHNVWAGDTVNFWRDGVYHLLYLIDRHHHGNRWGGGAHTFCHMTTTDFVNWIDYGPMFELEADWQSVGTGTMFFWQGDYYLAHGFHTNRVLPDEYLIGGRLQKRCEETGETKAFTYEEIASLGLTPNGANLMKSRDGIHWERVPVVFHWAENPSVYTAPDGSLRMYVGYAGTDGTWAADRPEGPWKRIDPSFPPVGAKTPMKNTAECPSFFEKDGYRYLIMGVTGFWQTGKNDENYTDMASRGYDIYDGLLVPMAVNCGGRLIMSGWLNGIGWGSVMLHRELLQEENGRLKMRWLPEEAPVRETLLHDDPAELSLPLDPVGKDYFELEVTPGQKPVSLYFGEDTELRLDPERMEVQIGPKDCERIEPAFEAAKKLGSGEVNPWQIGKIHATSRDFTLAHAEELTEPFTLRLVRRWEAKMHCTLIDLELSGKRTLISNRVDTAFDSLRIDPRDAKVTSFKAWKTR